MSQSGRIDLPHGSWINLNTNQVHIDMGQITLNWTMEEFELWMEQIDDIFQVYQALTQKSTIVCESCGTIGHMIDIVTDEDIN
jgi:hypothetical protein